MLNLNYVKDEKKYEVSFDRISKKIVKIMGDFPIKELGFVLTRDGSNTIIGDYSEYKTVYKEIEDGVLFSNDGSVYVEPTPKIMFNTTNGGCLEGEAMQEAHTYEELVVPTPIANEDYVFTKWEPEIPTSGEIDGDKYYTAVFESTLPPPEPEPTLEDRVAGVEMETAMLTECVLEMSSVIYA